MKPVKQLVRIRHGSHLYGTSTPASDTDYKGVHLPSGQAIIMQRAEDVIDDGVSSKAAGTLKNDADAIDSQSYSLAKFYGMLMKGDTVATEILFAPDPEYQDTDWLEVQRVGKELLNRQCKGFVGYCVRQAAKYGIKGSRMSAVKAMLDFIDAQTLGRTVTTKLSAIEPQLREWSKGREHVRWENIPNPNGSDNWHIDVCDRKMPMTAHISEARKVYDKVWENYGERARAAMTNQGIDWKAMSHAVRVAGQAIELLDNGFITFPRPDADLLLQIKRGEIGYDKVSILLERLVGQVHDASERSKLPEQSDAAIANAIIERMYLEQVNG